MAVDGWAGGRHAPRGAGLGALPAALWGRMLLQGTTCSASTEAKVQQMSPCWRSWHCAGGRFPTLPVCCDDAAAVAPQFDLQASSTADSCVYCPMVATGAPSQAGFENSLELPKGYAPLNNSGKPHEPLNSSGGAVPSIHQFCNVITVSVPPMWCSLTGAWNPARDSMQLTDASAIRRKSTPNIWATRPAESPRRQWATTDTFASESFSPWLGEASA